MSENNHLKDCVKKYLEQQKISQFQIKVNFNADTGSHTISKIATIEVHGKDKNDDDLQLNLIAKFAKNDEEYRKKMGIIEFFEREMFLYEVIIPHFEKLQKERQIKNVFKAYAGFCVSSKFNLEETLILENMEHKGFKVCDSSKPLDYHHAMLLLKEVGRLHALSFALRDQCPHIFKNIINGLKEIEFAGKNGATNAEFFHDMFAECMQTLDPSEDKRAINQYVNFEKVFFEKVRKSVDTSCLEPYAVVTHCNLWISNLLYKYNELREPSELCLIDWQLARMSSPASDISEVMFLCVDKEIREKHYQNLINDYYTNFSHFLQELGSDPKVMFPFNVLEEHLKKYSVHGLYMALRTISLTSFTEEYTPSLSQEDAFQSIYGTGKDSILYFKRIRDVLLDYIRYGYDF